MKIPIAKPVNDIKYIDDFKSIFISEVMSGMYIGGKNVTDYEKNLAKFLNKKYIASCNSGTDALILSLVALGIKPGDEVILPSFTYFATAESVMHVGAIPVFADIDDNSFCISVKTVEKLITKKTRCIIPVHLYGYDSDIKNIVKLAKSKKIYVLEDVAQAFGSKSNENKFLGTYGDINAFSNFPSKTLGGIGDGGFVATDNLNLYKKVSLLKNHGQSKNYEHEIMGTNSRLDSLNAFVLNNKLKNFSKIDRSRRNFVETYLNFFNNKDEIYIPEIQSNTLLNYFTIVLPDGERNKIQKLLENEGIQTNIYYKKPLHKQTALKNYGFKSKSLKNTDNLSKNILSLPLYSNPSKKELEYIKTKLKKVFKNYVWITTSNYWFWKYGKNPL